MKLTSVMVVVAMTASVGSAHAGWLADRRARRDAGRQGSGSTGAITPSRSPSREAGPLRRSPSASRVVATRTPHHVILVYNAERAVGTPVFQKHYDAAVAGITELYDEALKAGDLDGLETVKRHVTPLVNAYMAETGKRIDGGHSFVRKMQLDQILRDAGLYRVAYQQP